ncbi:MAG TPA: ComF family protein [bacterium]|nr:ComF family protein [bacterium]HOX84701.1 ComF family protein [bacterium]HPG45424.1 ComF family protein [bacterium]HPM96800.1 ComF family protein [bacterium]
MRGGRVSQTVRLWFRAALDFIYPPLCLLCERNLQPDEHLVCRNCWQSLPNLQPYEISATELNPAFCFDFSFAPFAYLDSMQTLIHALKYRGFRRLIAPLAEAVAASASAVLHRWGAEALVAVPLHSARLRERGYNQAELLADRLGNSLGLPSYSVLRRSRYTPPQAQRSGSERRQNVENAFAVPDPAAIIGKKLVVVDDILTTGYTIDGCARALLEAGSARVAALTIARAG